MESRSGDERQAPVVVRPREGEVMRKDHRGDSGISARAAWLLAAIIACGAPAWAAAGAGGEEEENFTELSLEELMSIPVYAASRYDQRLSEAPSSVSILTREEIRLYGYRTLAEVLAGLPGIYSSYDRIYHYLGVRGFSPPGDYNTRVLVLVNGQRVNEELYSNAGAGRDFLIDLDLIERLEVIRGPGSSLYGTNAFLAVVNVVTRDGKGLGGGEVAGEIASHETYKTRVTYGRPLGEAGQFLLSGSRLESGGQDLYFPEFDAPETNQGVATGLDGEEAGSLFLDLELRGLRLQAAYINREKEIPTAAWETAFNQPGSTTADAKCLAGLTYDHAFPGVGELFANLNFQDTDYRGHYPYDWAAKDQPTAIVYNHNFGNSARWSGEARLTTEEIPGHKLHFGLEFRDIFRLDQQNYDEGQAVPNLHSHEQAWVLGLFAQDELRLGERILFNGGLRYDQVEPGAGRFSPRAGLIVRAAARTTLKALYGQAFRAPNAYELYYGDGATQKGNPDLQPETLQSYEAILEQEIRDDLRAVLAVYHYRIRDLIAQTLDETDGLLVFRNLDRAEASGAEAEIQYKIPSGIDARASYAYCAAEDARSGVPLRNSPRHMGKGRLLLPLAGGRLFAAAELRYLGRRWAVDGQPVDEALVAGLTLTALRLHDRWEVSAGIQNLFDEEHADPTGSEHLQTEIPQDGRTFLVRVTCRF